MRVKTASGKPLPNLFDEKSAGRRRNQPFDPLLHKEHLHRYLKALNPPPPQPLNPALPLLLCSLLLHPQTPYL